MNRQRKAEPAGGDCTHSQAFPFLRNPVSFPSLKPSDQKPKMCFPNNPSVEYHNRQYVLKCDSRKDGDEVHFGSINGFEFTR
jgi:hypothetical protein